MSIVHLSDLLFSRGRGLKKVATAASRPDTWTSLTSAANSDRQIRVTPSLAFEAEELVPEENWRHRHGLPQTLDFPSIRTR